MCRGERPIGAAKGKQTNTMASCQPPPPLKSPCQENYPADAHPSALKSVLESANPAWTRRVHLDAPGQRHGQQPRLRDGRPPE